MAKLNYAGRTPAPKTKTTAWEQAQTTNDWLVPLCLLVGSALVVLLIAALIGEQLLPTLLGLSILATIETVVAIVAAFAVAGLLGTGFGPLWTGILKLAAVAMTGFATAVLFTTLIPIRCFSLVIYVGVIWLLSMTVLDLESDEAKWFVALFLVIRISVAMFLAAIVPALG